MVDQINLSTTDTTAVATAQAAADAASAAKFAAQAAPAPQALQANELIGGKFKTQDDLLKAYKELESKIGAPKAPDSPVSPATPPTTAPTGDLKTGEAASLTIDATAATAAAASAGFKMADLSAEYAANGDLTPETYAKLEKAGFGKDVVEVFIDGQKARVQAEHTQILTKAGVTSESFGAMIEWAKVTLSPEDIKSYNDAVNGPVGTRQFALEAMHHRFVRAQGSDPKLFTGQRGTPATNDIYRSTEQMVADMKNPLYAKDPAFRAEVEAKVYRSKLS